MKKSTLFYCPFCDKVTGMKICREQVTIVTCGHCGYQSEGNSENMTFIFPDDYPCVLTFKVMRRECGERIP